MKAWNLIVGLLLVLAVGCAGAPAGGTSSGGYDSGSKGLTKEQLKKMGIEENKG